jgi:hypothetical protein
VKDLKADIAQGKHFKLFHCYEVLHKTEKWKGQIQATPSSTSGKRKSKKVNDSSDEEERQLGNKHAKLVVVNQKKSEDVREVIKQQQLYRTKLEERKIAALEKSSENEKLSVEMNAMMQDAGPGSKERREKYFEIIQKRIIERMLLEDAVTESQYGSSSEDEVEE